MKYEWSFGAATFKRRLILLMEEKELSQQAVAEFAGVKQSTISRWLSGSKPELENVTALAYKTRVPLEWLAHGEGKLQIDYKGIDGFIYRAKQTVLPRLGDVINKFTTLQDANFLSPEEREIVEDIETKLRGRRARLAACVDALEKLPPEEEDAVREILSNHYSHEQSDFVRGEISSTLGLRGPATDDEVLEACRAALKLHPLTSGQAKAAQLRVKKE